MNKKRNTINVMHGGSQIKLDVDRIIALNPHSHKAYFEFVVWDLSEEDFTKVWNKWNGYDEDD